MEFRVGPCTTMIHPSDRFYVGEKLVEDPYQRWAPSEPLSSAESVSSASLIVGHEAMRVLICFDLLKKLAVSVSYCQVPAGAKQ